MPQKLFGLLALFLFATSTQAHAIDVQASAIDEIIQDALKKSSVPGLSIAIIRPGQEAYIKGFGMRSVEDRATVNAHTLFKLNSITKSMTATATAALVDDGRLSWGDPIIDHYPEFQLKDPWITRNTTIEDTFAHRVGLEATDWMEDIPGMSFEQAVHNMRYLPQTYAFRTHFLYDNFMYALGGAAAGRVAGNWDQLIEENLLKPLGMKESIVRVEDYLYAKEVTACHECELDHPARGLKALRKQVNIAAPHIYADGETRLTHWRWSSSRPAVAVWSTAHDMANYLKLYLGDGELNNKSILSSESMKKLTSPKVYIDALNPDMDENETRYGQMLTSYAFGWRIGDYMGHPSIQHSGGSIGYSSFVIILPEDGLAIAIMANLRDGEAPLVEPLAMDIIDKHLGLKPVSWVEYFAQEHRQSVQAGAIRMKEKKENTAYEPSPLSSTAYAGIYHHAAYGDITVELGASNALILRQGNERWGMMRHLHNNIFELTWNGVRPTTHLVQFNIDLDNQIQHLILEEQTFLPLSPVNADKGNG